MNEIKGKQYSKRKMVKRGKRRSRSQKMKFKQCTLI